MFMLRRLELAHQMGTSVASIAAGTGSLPLWQLLETVSPLLDCKLLFMTVNTVSGQERIEDEAAIRSYDLRHALTEGTGKEARLVRDYALIDLHYKQGRDEKPMMATVSITAEGEDDHSIYSRVTVTIPPRNASRMNSLSNEGRQPHSVSLLIALDRSDDKKRQQEFEYMWSDAQLKAHNGEKESLSEDQLLLGQVRVADVAYNMYWGVQAFNSGRYYEAILYLENVFNSYRCDFFEMGPEGKRLFMETAYKLGFCYNELGLNKQAFYYLDLMANDGNIRHTMEYVNSMANNNKPMFMIGNCCLTNKFDQSVCFGEALLRKGNNGGAVAYIGGTNSTYWDQDFYWSVGIRNGINNTMNATYDPSNLGIYDRLFHTHGESRNNQAITAGAIVFYGNSAVHASGSSDNNMKKYYWEIYELMGDPSLMPWLGPASDLTEFSYERSASVVQVTTVADAYVALVDTATHNLVAAAYANSGTANLTVPEDVNLGACSFVVIAQGYKPYFSVEMQPLLNLDKVDAEFSLYPNPASDRCTVVADSIATVVLLDNRGTVVSTFKPAGNTCDIDLSALPRGIYFVQVQTADNMSARKLVVR